MRGGNLSISRCLVTLRYWRSQSTIDVAMVLDRMIDELWFHEGEVVPGIELNSLQIGGC